MGQEPHPDAYAVDLVSVFEECRRVLRPDGVLWVVIGDSYATGEGGPEGDKESDDGYLRMGRAMRGSAPAQRGVSRKCRLGIPARFILAMIHAGWIWRDEVIWHKPNPMPPGGITDRTAPAHEQVLMFAKEESYHYEPLLDPFADARRGRDGGTAAPQRNRGGRRDGFTKPSGIDPSANGGRRRRSVWTVPFEALPARVRDEGEHYARYPIGLVLPMIQASTRPGDLVLDPFSGTGTTGEAALRLRRSFLGFELSPASARMAEARLRKWRGQQRFEAFGGV